MKNVSTLLDFCDQNSQVIYIALWGVSTTHWWIPSKGARNMKLWCLLCSQPKQAVEKRIEIELLVIWNTIMLMRWLFQGILIDEYIIIVFLAWGSARYFQLGCFKIQKFWVAVWPFTHLWCMPKETHMPNFSKIGAGLVPPSRILWFRPGGLEKRNIFPIHQKYENCLRALQVGSFCVESTGEQTL